MYAILIDLSSQFVHWVFYQKTAENTRGPPPLYITPALLAERERCVRPYGDVLSLMMIFPKSKTIMAYRL